MLYFKKSKRNFRKEYVMNLAVVKSPNNSRLPAYIVS